jgi:hypothetical protein
LNRIQKKIIKSHAFERLAETKIKRRREEVDRDEKKVDEMIKVEVKKAKEIAQVEKKELARAEKKQAKKKEKANKTRKQPKEKI